MFEELLIVNLALLEFQPTKPPETLLDCTLMKLFTFSIVVIGLLNAPLPYEFPINPPAPFAPVDLIYPYKFIFLIFAPSPTTPNNPGCSIELLLIAKLYKLNPWPSKVPLKNAFVEVPKGIHCPLLKVDKSISFVK